MSNVGVLFTSQFISRKCSPITVIYNYTYFYLHHHSHPSRIPHSMPLFHAQQRRSIKPPNPQAPILNPDQKASTIPNPQTHLLHSRLHAPTPHKPFSHGPRSVGPALLQCDTTTPPYAPSIRGTAHAAQAPAAPAAWPVAWPATA